jgi:hypothetical protein
MALAPAANREWFKEESSFFFSCYAGQT